jgi:hypothetical protein
MSYENREDLIQYLKEAVEASKGDYPKLPPEVLGMNGMSSPKIRKFLNSLCGHGGCKYLEIGTWAGSTLIPAMYRNGCDAIAIDDFSQFQEQNPRKQLEDNLKRYREDIGMLVFLEKNCYGLSRDEMDTFPKFNVFFYDGNHGKVETEAAIMTFGALCHDPFILVVDDMELTPTVWEGTKAALNNFTLYNPVNLKKADDYHEGIFAAVVERLHL